MAARAACSELVILYVFEKLGESQLIEGLEPGDYVMVHAGVAIAKITDEDDSETDQVLEDLF